jgi:phosphoglycerate dehydrogenase-like enzyme
MTPTRRIVVNLREHRPLWDVPSWAVDEIRAALPDDWECVVLSAPSDGTGDGGGVEAHVLEAVRGAEVYLGYGVPRDLFLAARETLRWAHSAAAGVGGSLYPEMVASAATLTNSAGVHAEPIADTVLAMMLHFARGLDWAVRAQAERSWGKEPFEAADAPVRELSEGTVGLLGFGGIGAAVARRALALGTRVAALRRSSAPAHPGVEVISGDGALDRLLAIADYLVVTVPRTAETEGMIGARELALLPPGAVVVNVSRGGIVDEAALGAALLAGALRGAALDVFATEPLPASSPLWGLPNLLVLPHVSGTSHRFWRRETDLIVANLRRYLAGDRLLNTVDKHAGY